MNEVLSHRLFRDAGVPAAGTSYARVYVTVSGKLDRQYLGLYSVVENVDKTFARTHFGTAEGALFKPVSASLFDDLGDDWAKYNQPYDPKTKLTDAQKQRMIDFCKLVAHADDAEFAAKFGDFVDLEEVLPLHGHHRLALDARQPADDRPEPLRLPRPQDHKFQFMPWDLDHSSASSASAPARSSARS
jgi:spore coat protein CotH